MKVFPLINLIIFQNIFLFVNAQDQLPVEKRMIQAENGKVYINRDLGVYLWISYSPDENSKKHRLFSDSTSRFTNPMFFDTEGYNTFRSPSAVDTTTRRMIYPEKDIIFEVYCDGIAPKTQFHGISQNTSHLSGKLFYGANSRVLLKSNDLMSGVEKTFYSIDGSVFAEYKDTITLEKDGTHSLKFYSTDLVGNREEVKTLDYTIDNTPPESTIEIKGKSKKGEPIASSTILLSAKDNLSGVKAIYYQIKNGPVKMYTSPISYKTIGKNIDNLSYYSVDNVNNSETKKVAKLK